MNTWFECRIRYEKTMMDGMQKKVTEPYLVDALSFTEAEARIIEEMMPFISGEFTVKDIRRASYGELFQTEEGDADRWYKCKLWYITLDEKSGAEKKQANTVLVQAADLRDAVKKLDEGMNRSLIDYVIASIAETGIMDVFPYEAEEEPDVNGRVRNGAESPVVKNFIQSLPEGCRTELTIGGKSVVIDKTGRGTKVIPNEGSEVKDE